MDHFGKKIIKKRKKKAKKLNFRFVVVYQIQINNVN
jgi:hypothetical protein